MFHLQQIHFGKTKFLKFFLTIISVERKIKSQHKYVDIGAYRTYFLNYEKYPATSKRADI